MDELITKRQAVERINDLMVIELKMTRPPTWNEVYNAIEELPSAQHRPFCHLDSPCPYQNEEIKVAQEKGYWRNYEGTLQCSVCNAEFNKEIMEYCGDDVPRFCPDCGADTRGEWVWQRRDDGEVDMRGDENNEN